MAKPTVLAPSIAGMRRGCRELQEVGLHGRRGRGSRAGNPLHAHLHRLVRAVALPKERLGVPGQLGSRELQRLDASRQLKICVKAQLPSAVHGGLDTSQISDGGYEPKKQALSQPFKTPSAMLVVTQRYTMFEPTLVDTPAVVQQL